MLVTTVKLPADGADYRCTFSDGSTECRTVTKRGLIVRDYVALSAARPANVTFMRALCDEHVMVVSTFIPSNPA